MAKRKSEVDERPSCTPKRTRSSAVANDEDTIAGSEQMQLTPSRTRSQKETPVKRIQRLDAEDDASSRATVKATPRTQRKLTFVTPTKGSGGETADATPTHVRNADRSARRKSTRRLLETAEISDDEGLDGEDALAREILEEEDDEGDEEESAPDDGLLGTADIAAESETPSKRKRGRPKGSKNKAKATTPPPNLPPHEQYFWHNRPGAIQTSNNTLPLDVLLNHDEYFEQMQEFKDTHEDSIEFLHSLHTRSFAQWTFELQQGFNICLYGYGSKRHLTQSFATHLHKSSGDEPPRIIMINGYEPTLTVRDVLTTLASTLPIPRSTKLPLQPSPLLSFLLTTLQKEAPETPIYLILNSIDSPSLRRSQTQSLLAQLAASPQIALFATADMPNFPLLWDLSLRAQFKFLFHDATTFASYDGAEIEDVVESVNELLGRSSRRIQGRDGVAYVLKSLPENARSLFRVLVAEQVAAALEDFGAADPENEDADEDVELPGSKKQKQKDSDAGVEYRVLYHKAVEELICTNEMQFRGLLKEFHDHQMVESRRDAMGTERLVVPFRRAELEALLEELIS